uniref:Component of cytochrome b6/f complex n=1 Tax=Chromera velia TaxID=505693 RepID=D9IXH5_9ALVE|nr:component of cytochrome b6/f complex [Chromera velia]ADJ66503.2 component of cytochrome b6/f complex [Chromera velia]
MFANFPIYAQQGNLIAREANGKLVCANCHLNNYPIKIYGVRHLINNEVFNLKLSVDRPNSALTQSASLNGSKKFLGLGGIVILPEQFDVVYRPAAENPFIPYSTEEDQTLVVGPLYTNKATLNIPVRSPAAKDGIPTTNMFFGGINRGRGQLTPLGVKTDTNKPELEFSNLSVGQIWRSSKGHLYMTQANSENLYRLNGNLHLTWGDNSAVIVNSPNQGGFGQSEFSTSVLNLEYLVNYLFFTLFCVSAQISLIIYKKDYLVRRSFDTWSYWCRFALPKRKIVVSEETVMVDPNFIVLTGKKYKR